MLLSLPALAPPLRHAVPLGSGMTRKPSRFVQLSVAPTARLSPRLPLLGPPLTMGNGERTFLASSRRFVYSSTTRPSFPTIPRRSRRSATGCRPRRSSRATPEFMRDQDLLADPLFLVVKSACAERGVESTATLADGIDLKPFLDHHGP